MAPVDTQLLRSQVQGLCKDILQDTEQLERTYKYLYTKSPTLFRFVIENAKCPNFDKAGFTTNVEMMLSNLEKVQAAKLTQHDASVIVGESLADKYFPQRKK